MSVSLLRLVGRLLAGEYGMLFMLLVLVAVFSATTLKTWQPEGEEAGLQVAEGIRADVSRGGAVVIVLGEDLTEADGRLQPAAEDFVQAIQSQFTSSDFQVIDTITGQPFDVRRQLEATIAEGTEIVAVATAGNAADWTVFEHIPQIGQERLFAGQPYVWPIFLRVDNLRNIAGQTAVFAIIAIGMTLVIISAGIDLSVGSLVALGSVTMAMLIQRLGQGAMTGTRVILLASMCGVGVCTLAGIFSGTVSTVFRIPAFVVTLSMMRIGSGLAFRMTGGIAISDMPAVLNELGLGVTLGIPHPVWIMLLLYAFAHFVMTPTVFGRYVYAVGGNQEAARLVGVPVRRVLISVYAISGALAGLGGLILTGQLDSGDPKLGRMYELEVITAVVVGGASLMGGEGRVLGTLIGALIIAVIKNGMNQMRIDPFDQEIVLGSVLLATVLLDTLRHRRGSRSVGASAT
ncbi:MAG: ABC transporter permease [Planctomycetaceae bacterium]|nr:ABC transporter permease [Planctomycetaceae bacterium]